MPTKGQLVWTKALREADPEGWAQEEDRRRAAETARKANWRAKNPDKVRASVTKWEDKNPDKVRARKAKWRVKNKGTKKFKLTELVSRARRIHIEHHKQPKETCTLDTQKLLDLWEKQGGCDLYTGVPLVHESGQPGTVSIDRIDNSIGYVEGNFALTTQFWNYARNNTTIYNALRELEVHVEYFIPKQGPRNAAALILKAISHFNPADRAACLRYIQPKKPKRATAEVLPLFSANDTQKESA